MSKKRVRINLTSEQASKLRHDVFGDLRLSAEERRKAVSKELLIPSDGSHVDLYCDGHLVGEV